MFLASELRHTVTVHGLKAGCLSCQLSIITTLNNSRTQKLNAWQEYMSAVYYDLDIVPLSADKVRGELYEVQFPSIGLSQFKADAQKVVRHKSAAQRDKSENFVFLFPTRQRMAFEQNGRAGVVLPGSVFLLNSAEDT